MSSRPIAADYPFGTALAYLLLGVNAGLALDICAKWLLADYSIEQFVLLRSFFGLCFFLLAARWYGGIASLRSKRWSWHLLRTVFSTGAMFGFFYGLARMPLVNALTIAFTAPLIVTALSAPVLGEHVGWRRWLAVSAGFAGVMIVLRPGEGMLTTASLAVLFAAFCWAGLMLTARKLATTETSFALSFYVVFGPMVVALFLIPGDYAAPTISGWALFILAGLCSAVAWFGIVGGYRRAPPVVLAPFEYTALIGGALAGYFIWHEIPDRWVVAGGAIIMTSGIYIVVREVGGNAGNRYLRALASSGAAFFVRIRSSMK